MDAINSKKMLDFYKNFDAIQFKYDLKDYDERYDKCETKESFCQFAELTKMEYGDILNNLDLIYASEENSDDIVQLFDLIRNKIINQYIGIEGLERLFSEKYIDFEWDMHLGMDYKKHEMHYYRDHFIHQVRNAYCMHVLLDECGWLTKVEEVLKNPSYSKISTYVCKYIGQQKSKNCNEIDEVITDIEQFFWKNVIYMACYMAALFHDIGYPERFNIKNQRRITEYIANLYNMETSLGYNYMKLNSLLQNSLLFRIVSFDEIERRLSKTDHGALSAVIFLTNFYENGAIHGLEPYRRCAIELAALAIYNHTNEYRYEGKIEKGDYAKISFVLNPISYLLRLSDDLQEWDRIYFELSNRSNMIICNTCMTPVVRTKKEKGICYKCNCNHVAENEKVKMNGVFQPIFNYGANFSYRRIYNVIVCEELQIIDNEVMVFHLDYKLDKLLHIAYINAEYAKYRSKELNKLKKMLDYQQVLKPMKLDYFVTSNPILIKTQIMSEYLLANKTVKEKLVKDLDELSDNFQKFDRQEEKSTDEYDSLYDKWTKLGDAWKEIFVDIAEQIYSDSAEYDTIKKCVNKSIDLYWDLLVFMYVCKQYNQKGTTGREILDQKGNQIVEVYSAFGDEELRGLLTDCFKQFECMYSNISQLKANPPKYYKQFYSLDYTYGCIKRFTSARNYIPVCENGQIKIDAYTDLAFMQKLLGEISKEGM